MGKREFKVWDIANETRKLEEFKYVDYGPDVSIESWEDYCKFTNQSSDRIEIVDLDFEPPRYKKSPYDYDPDKP